MAQAISDEEFYALIESETKRIGPVVGIRWQTGYAIILASELVKLPKSKLDKLIGGSYEKRKPKGR